MTKSLWPEELFQSPEEWEKKSSSPYSILQLAAEQLGARTDELLVGNVKRYLRRKEINLVFYVECPAIRYQCSLFEVKYGIASQGYPVTLIEEIGEPHSTEWSDSDSFITHLKEVLSSERIKKIINNLYHHCKEAQEC